MSTNDNLYRVLSALLCYPQQDLIDALPEIEAELARHPQARDTLAPLVEYLGEQALITLQENYVATFDRVGAHSLHLFEHIHGESRDRGQALVDLMEEYKRHGFEMATSELPDYVPLFLEFLSVIDKPKSDELLGEAIHVLASIGKHLGTNDSVYACVFIVLMSLTDVEPQEQTAAPVRTMDEAMEMFGTGFDGVEPLLKSAGQGLHTIQFHPRRPATADAKQGAVA